MAIYPTIEAVVAAADSGASDEAVTPHYCSSLPGPLSRTKGAASLSSTAVLSQGLSAPYALCDDLLVTEAQRRLVHNWSSVDHQLTGLLQCSS